MFIRLFSALFLISALSGCAIIEKMLGNTPRDLGDTAQVLVEKAMGSLDQNSAQWQTVLQKLSSDMMATEKQFVGDVDHIVQRGVASTGDAVACKIDFTRDRVKEDLGRLLAKITNKVPPPLKPAVCHVVFGGTNSLLNSVDMANRPKEISFHGYNLQATGDRAPQLFLKHAGGEIPLRDFVNFPTDYILTLKTGAEDGAPLCNLQQREIIMKSGGEVVHSVAVQTASCVVPQAPQAHLPRVVQGFPIRDTATGKVAGAGGFGEDRVYGGQCTAGSKRSSKTASIVGTNSSSSDATWWYVDGAGGEGWTHAEETSCEIKIHYSIKPPYLFNPQRFITLEIVIQEEGIPQPPPIAPLCCR
jgi:hypothetical protein